VRSETNCCAIGRSCADALNAMLSRRLSAVGSGIAALLPAPRRRITFVSDPPLELRRDERRLLVVLVWPATLRLLAAAFFWLGVCFAVRAPLGAVEGFWPVVCAPAVATASTLPSAITTIPIEPNLFMK
jgi:hypothetical protein